VLLPSFFTNDEIDEISRDFQDLFGTTEPAQPDAVRDSLRHDMDEVPLDQFEHIASMPFASSTALNLLALHPGLIKFVRAALGTNDVQLYQNLAWAKVTGATDYEQPFHMDYHNHTLLVPGDAPEWKTVNLSIYVTDVTDAHGAIHYVTRDEGDAICGSLRHPNPTDEQQAELRAIERSGAGLRGSVFAYSTDVYHRATNLTAPAGSRYTLFVGYKAASNSAILGNPWPSTQPFRGGRERFESNPWGPIIAAATPEQLSCLGFPRPGDDFWNAESLARAAHRWPTWNVEPWCRAVRQPSKRLSCAQN
jgi:hypothetical protein